jgi:hypothetical protein
VKKSETKKGKMKAHAMESARAKEQKMKSSFGNGLNSNRWSVSRRDTLWVEETVARQKCYLNKFHGGREIVFPPYT